MLKEERQNIILEEIRAKNKVHSSDLSKKLDVSEDTIRRDLRELAENGHIKKVHGGAMAYPHTPEFLKKKKVPHQTERVTIVKKVLPYIVNYKVILLTGDSTCETLVDHLPKDFAATILTNSLSIATKLLEFHSIETFFLGGKLSKKSRVSIGMDVIKALDEIHADLCVFSTSSIHADIGIMEKERETALTQKAMLGAAANVITLCLSNDIGKMQPFKVEGLNRINTLVTELDKQAAILDSLKNKGVDVI